MKILVRNVFVPCVCDLYAPSNLSQSRSSLILGVNAIFFLEICFVAIVFCECPDFPHLLTMESFPIYQQTCALGVEMIRNLDWAAIFLCLVCLQKLVTPMHPPSHPCVFCMIEIF